MSSMVRSALRQITSFAGLADHLAPDDDLFAAGLSSFDLINLILCLENLSGVEFPHEVMTRDHFSTVARIDETITALTHKEPAP